MNKSDKKLFIYGVGSLLVGMLIKAAARKIWSSTKKTPVPDNPADPKTDTVDAILWTTGLAALSGFGKLAYRSLFSPLASDLKDDAELLAQDSN